MDMQPLEALPEVSPAERRRKNQQIVSRATRSFQKAKNNKFGGIGLSSSSPSSLGGHPHDEDHDGSLLMMMSSSAAPGEEEDDDDMEDPLHPGKNNKEPPSSPSKRLLLIKNHNNNEESSSTGNRSSSNHINKLRPVVMSGGSSSSSNVGRGMKKHHTKRSSATKMSTKITKALFRERKSSHANFSKMDSMASDAHGSHFKRSARSPFYAVEPRSSRSVDHDSTTTSSQQQQQQQQQHVGSPQPSFDTTSIQSAPAPSVPNVRITVRANTPPPPPAPRQRQQPQQLQEYLAGGIPAATTIMTAGSNISALSMTSSDFGSASSAFHQTINKGSALSAATAPMRTMMMVPAPPSSSSAGKAPSSIASSASSLNYSESQCASSYELQRPVGNNNYSNNNNNNNNNANNSGLSLIGVKLAKSTEDAEFHQGEPNLKASAKNHAVVLKTSISDLVQERRALLQERLLERLDQEEEDVANADDARATVNSTNVISTPKQSEVTAAGAVAAPATAPRTSKIPILKPPPSKFPTTKNQRKIVMDGRKDDSGAYDKYYGHLHSIGNDAATTATTATTDTTAAIDHSTTKNQTTKYQNIHRGPKQQKELELLLRGGDFMDESHPDNHHAAGPYSSSSSAGKNDNSSVDVARRLLQLLEAAQSDSELMMEHHNKDPSLVMANSVASFGGSTISTLRSTSAAATSSSSLAAASKTSSLPATVYSSQPGGGGESTSKSSNFNAQASSTTSAYDNSSNPYAGLMMEEGLGLPPPPSTVSTMTTAQQQRSRSLPAATKSLVEEEAEDEEDELVVHHDDESGIKSLCYLYSQDKEFENSILSPGSTVHSSVHNGSHMSSSYHTGGSTMSPLPAAASAASPKHMYRSDAIDAFLEKAQTNINNSCTKDDCVLQVMEQAAENVLDGGVVAKGGSVSIPNEPSDTIIMMTNTMGSTAPFDEQIDYCSKEEGSDTGIRQEEDGKTIVSDEFLNMMTSGCTGVPNDSAKEAVKEKLVALEAGWSGFRSQVNERIQSLEESWQGWNLNSLLHQFNSPTKARPEAEAEAESAEADRATTKNKELPSLTEAEAAAVMTPATMGSTTVLTTPSTMSTPKMPNQQQPSSTGKQLEAHNTSMTPKTVFPEDPLEQVELISQADESVVGVMKSPMSIDETQEEVVLGVVRELERSRSRLSGRKTPQDPFDNNPVENADGIERIGTTECDVPLSLKHNLADISIIADGSSNPNQSGSSSSRAPNRPPFLDSSRDDSEGGKVVLDIAGWDPVDSSAEVYEEETPEMVQAATEAPSVSRHDAIQKNKTGGFALFKRRNRSKKKAVQSPKSVLSGI